MSKFDRIKERAKSLEAKDPRGAIDAWMGVLKAQEAEADANPDLSILNHVGDLYLKVKDPAQAADYYDRAVDRYAELGLHNNAIAMCNKVLRNAPGRQTTYLKLAKLYAAKGFMGEARQNFVAYAERMQKIGKIQQAFAALKELTDISPESARLREMLEEHLAMYGDAAEARREAGSGQDGQAQDVASRLPGSRRAALAAGAQGGAARCAAGIGILAPHAAARAARAGRGGIGRVGARAGAAARHRIRGASRAARAGRPARTTCAARAAGPARATRP